MNMPPLAALPFRPVSIDDFYQYAKSLSRLIDEPPQSSQQLLARVYGYSGLHDLQTVMASPGSPGPFDWEARSTWPPSVEGLDERRSRLLRLVAEQKGVSHPRFLPDRCTKVVDLDLFDTPPRHRAARKRLFDMLTVQEHEPSVPSTAGPHLGIGAYATIALTDKGEAYTRLTALGAAVRNAVDDIFRDGTRPEPAYEGRRAEQRRLAIKIFNDHPDCPWPLASLIIHHARALGQGGWKAPLYCPPSFDQNGEFIYPSITEQFRADIVENAKKLFPDVIKAVDLFEPLYEGVDNYASEIYTPDDHDRIDYDVSTWSQLLYWGGRVAANAGEQGYALKLLEKVHGMKGHSAQHWAQEPLAALTLDKGLRRVMACFPRDHFFFPTPWQCLAFATSVSPTSAQAASVFFVQAMFRSVTVIEVFNVDAPRLPALTSYPLEDAPDSVHEFMWMSAPFWKKHPGVRQLFERIAGDSEVLEPVLDWHRTMRAEGIYNYTGDPRFRRLEKKVIKAAGDVVHACSS